MRISAEVADYDQIPKWAVERLAQIEAPQMKIRIFQIDHDKDSNKLAFMNYDYAQAHGGVDSSIYRQIYGGTVNCKSLESGFLPSAIRTKHLPDITASRCPFLML